MTGRALRAAIPILVGALLAVAAPAAAYAATPKRPDVGARSAIVVEVSTGDVAYERKADSRRAIASTTKLMTALLTLERARLSETFTAVPYDAMPVESKINLRAGERMRVADLLRGLLLASANDAAATLAVRVGGSQRAFVRRMNARARALGLGDTRFANPIGLDAARNYSTARELVQLSLSLRRFEFFKRTVNRPAFTLKSGDRPRTVVNRNTLVRRVPWVNGVKTGHTQAAGYVLVSSATRRGVTLVSVVLGAPNESARNADTLALLRYGFKRYRRAVAVRRGERFARVPIRFRRGAELNLVAARTVRRVIRRGRAPRVRATGVPAEVTGPVRKGQRLGMVEVAYRDGEVRRVPLVAAAAVPEAALVQRGKDFFTRPLTLVLAIVAVCSVVAVLMRRRLGRDRSRSHREVETA